MESDSPVAVAEGARGPAATAPESSDQALVTHLRGAGRASIADLVRVLGVTATAVRQRLNRLMDQGLVARQADPAVGRGRPVHRYSLTPAGVRSAGTSYDQLAQVLWDEVRAIENAEVRRGLLARLSQRLAALYRGQVTGPSLAARMGELAAIMAEQNLPFAVDGSGALPVLTALACPFPDIAANDRGVCAMEKMLISEVLGETMRLSACRLDGANCCTFEAAAAEAAAEPVGA
ncbi:MAG TPA: MarR family transcriptional regulator [Lacipirellulaceae bacterium]|nr:MarR family transcriptional regulator [Lacipirellulaceae bacterium]